MTQPLAFPGRPPAPVPGATSPELRIARVRSHARTLVWPVIVLVAVAAAVGFFTGNLPAPLRDWMLWLVAGVVVVFLVLVPWLRWLARTYTITTRRVIAQEGLVRRVRRELTHTRGYTITERRGPVQRLWGAGTLILAGGVDHPMEVKNIPGVSLVHEVLSDQIEVGQILAHRDSHQIPVVGQPPQV